jgi:hypothetical protein
MTIVNFIIIHYLLNIQIYIMYILFYKGNLNLTFSIIIIQFFHLLILLLLHIKYLKLVIFIIITKLPLPLYLIDLIN